MRKSRHASFAFALFLCAPLAGCVDDLLIGSTTALSLSDAAALDATTPIDLEDGSAQAPSDDGSAPVPSDAGTAQDASDDAGDPFDADASEDGGCDGGYLECEDDDGVLGPCAASICVIINVGPIGGSALCAAGEAPVCWEVGDGSCATVCKPEVACGRGEQACADDEYCHFADGSCQGATVCAPLPIHACREPAPDQETCGCDGATYASQCQAAELHVSVQGGFGACGSIPFTP